MAGKTICDLDRAKFMIRPGFFAALYIRDARSPPPSSERASYNMSRNRAKDTAPELALRKALWAAGHRGYRLHARGVPGRPDVVFSPAKLAIFVHGCFWHGCPMHSRAPQSNSRFWKEKFARNVARDVRKETELLAAGWTVLTFWEHDVREDLPGVVRKIGRALARSRARAT